MTQDIDKQQGGSASWRSYLKPNDLLLEDAEQALDNLTRQEILLIKEAEELFKTQVTYVKQIDSLREYVPNMDKIVADTRRLSGLVDSSSGLVEEVCSRFRHIDLAKARLDQTLSKIGDILDVNKCRRGLVKAMKSGNYEEAAMHIKRFLSIDKNELKTTITIICGDGAAMHGQPRRMLMDIDDDQTREAGAPVNSKMTVVDPESINSALAELDQARTKLLASCQEELDKAIEGGNVKDIERFFKIFPMLNEHQDGLLRYSRYLQSKMIDQQVDAKFKSKETNQADKLAALYENIARIIDAHQPLIETYYGPGHLIVVVGNMQKECDKHGRKILEEFRNETKLQYVAKIARHSSLQPISQTIAPGAQNAAILNLNPSKLDPRSVDKILNEISLIISRSEVYLSFIVQRIKDDSESGVENESQKKASSLALYNMIYVECELNHLIQEVGGIYVMLEQFYLSESTKKAITMDQIDTDPSHPGLISSMLDDIFFLLKKCTKRAISTKSNEVFCAIINHCVTLLESTFCFVLEDRLRNQQYYPTLSTKNLDFSQAYNVLKSGRYLQSANDQEKSNAQYFSALNNLDKACDYMKTLRGLLDDDVKKLKPPTLSTGSMHAYQLEKSLTCLNEMSQLTNRFTSIINTSLYHLFNSSLRNRIRTDLKVVVEDNPELKSIISNDSDELTSLAKNLLKTSDACLEVSLLPENYSKLVSITQDFVSSSLKLMK